MICTSLALVDPIVARIIGIYIEPAPDSFLSVRCR
jgi:hypothetical protein